MFGVGLGVVTFALFPLLIPGLAVLALFALPLLPLAIPVILLIPVWLAGRALARRLSRRGQSAPARTAVRSAPGAQPQA